MTRLLISLTVVLLATTSNMDAQTHPDFSGRWSSNPVAATGADRGAGAANASGAARGGGRAGGAAGRGREAGAGRGADMGSGWGAEITITQDAARMTVQYAFFGRGDMQPPLRFTYLMNGSESKNSVMMGRGIEEQLSKSGWQGDTLVISTIHKIPEPIPGGPSHTEVKRLLSLSPDSLLTVETIRPGVGGGPPSTVRTVYRKL